MTDVSRDTPLAVLVNVMCGHVGGICGVQWEGMAEQRRVQLQALGFRGWRVQVRPVADEELAGLIAGERCDRCRLDH